MTPSPSISGTVECSGASAEGCAWLSSGGVSRWPGAERGGRVPDLPMSGTHPSEPPPDSRQGSFLGSCATERSECRIAGRVPWCASCMMNANDSGGDSRQCRSMSVQVRRGVVGGQEDGREAINIMSLNKRSSHLLLQNSFVFARNSAIRTSAPTACIAPMNALDDCPVV